MTGHDTTGCRRLAATAAVFFSVLPSSLFAYFFDDFSAGVGGWTGIGDAAVVQEEAVLTDATTAYTAMYQAIAFDPGVYMIDFDVQGRLSAEIPRGTLPDVAFASVYFTDDPAQFDLLGGTWGGASALFDLFAAGFSGVQGALGASAKGSEWTHYTGTFELSFAYAIPVFELVADNSISGDSAVRIDNIQIGLIPEPQALALVLVGMAMIGAWRRLWRRRCE